MGPKSDIPRKNKLAKKIRSRTPDLPDYKDLGDVSKITDNIPDLYMGIDRKVWKEYVNIVYKKDLKLAMREKRISVREGALLLGIFYNMGNVGNACYELNIGRSNHNYWISTNPHYKEFYQLINEHWMDLAEEKLKIMGIVEGDFNSLKLLLETKGKDRGYSKESLITQNVTPTQFIVNFSGPKTIKPEDKPYELLPPDSGSEGAED